MEVKLKDVNFKYIDGGRDKVIFNNFSLRVKSGGFFLILGPSGCGKSTLLYIIGGLLEPNSGQVFLDHLSYYDQTQGQMDRFRKEYMGYIFQDFYLVDDLSPIDNVLISMQSNARISEKKIKVRSIFKKLGIDEKQDSKLKSFSGGEQQRLAIARAIAQNSRILICDEPTGNLDETNETEIMNILKELNREGKTIIMVTHNRSLCSYADEVLELTPHVRLGGIKR